MGKQNIALLAESTPLEDIETGKTFNQCSYFKAKVLTSHSATEINGTIKDSISEKSIVFSDKSTSYVNIADYVGLHFTEKSNKETTKKVLIFNIEIFTANATLFVCSLVLLVRVFNSQMVNIE